MPPATLQAVEIVVNTDPFSAVPQSEFESMFGTIADTIRRINAVPYMVENCGKRAISVLRRCGQFNYFVLDISFTAGTTPRQVSQQKYAEYIGGRLEERPLPEFLGTLPD